MKLAIFASLLFMLFGLLILQRFQVPTQSLQTGFFFHALMHVSTFGHGQASQQDHTCPHDQFVKKHWCEYCKNEWQALEFSIDARDDSPTGRNTVLTGQDITFQVDSRGLCANLVDLKPVFECNLGSTESQFCRLKGEKCMTYHSPENGHMFYQETSCI